MQITKLSSDMAVTSKRPQDSTAIANILMSAHNAFGIRGKEMGRFANMLFEARSRGVMEYGEIQTGAGKVFQTGALAGFSGLEGKNGLQGLLALMTGATKQGGTAANNLTMMARFISEIAQPATIKRLADRGIEVNEGDPMGTIQKIVATEQASRAQGEGSFIQKSGVFTRELGRRGGAITTGQWSEIQKHVAEDRAGARGVELCG